MLKPNEDDHVTVAAVCLIKAVPGQERAVFRSLKEVSGVKSLYHIFGDHDLFMILETKGVDPLRRTLNYIKEMPSVNAVKAMQVEPDGKCSIVPGCGRSALFSTF
jgi:DNA-binding Lrp family transcriptional regulator